MEYVIVVAGVVILAIIIIYRTSQLESKYRNLADSLKADLAQKFDSNISNISNQIQQSSMGISESLGKISQASNTLISQSQELVKFKELLTGGQGLRGRAGEIILEVMLSNTLPKENYSCQYTFRNGERVDAVVKLVDNKSLSIDSKFPLSNFDKDVKAFKRDIKGHITDISKKYICPDEGTLDFALMYVPAENIYSQIASDEEICNFARSQNVIPVSPNTLFAYLKVISVGLKGLRIEEQAKVIVEELGRLKIEFEKVEKQFSKMGDGVSGLGKAYSETEKIFREFSNRLHRLT